MKTFVSIGVHSWLLFGSLAAAAPLDDRIDAFEQAAQQNEPAVSAILEAGLAENRSALAFAKVKPWLTAHPNLSQQVLFRAGQAAERAGEWNAATSFYRKLLKDPQVDATLAATATPAMYRLLINHLGDPEAAYLFMREDGARLRGFGRADRFDRWFLERAAQRTDLVALARWHAAILNGNDPPDRHQDSLGFLLGELETFSHEGEALFAALDELKSAKRTDAGTKARIDWVKAILPLCPPAAELAGAKKAIPEDHFNPALPAAAALVEALPFEGSRAVITGWMNFNAGDSGVFASFVNPGREAKAAPVLAALRRMPPARAREILGLTVAKAKSRKAAGYLFSQVELRALVRELPEVFNTLNAPDVPLFDDTLTLAEAQAMAPNLARNPHIEAALVRAFAAGEPNAGAAVDRMVKSESWRLADPKTAVDAVWRHPAFGLDGEDRKAVGNRHPDLGPRHSQLKQQLAKEADGKERLAAFNTLLKDLLAPAPSVPGALALWDELFANAPDADKVTMLKILTANLQGDREYLLHRACEKSVFAGNGRLPWQAAAPANHSRHHQQGTRKNAAALIAHLGELVRSQAQAGAISETIFGLWLHSVDPGQPEAAALIESLVDSPAYAQLDPAYHRVAAERDHFGPAALTAALAADQPAHLGRELLALPQNPEPAAVDAALQAAVDRLAAAPVPLALTGLRPVAALPEWSDATRARVLSLFGELAPLGEIPALEGYEALVERLADEMAEAGKWGELEPYGPALWHAAAATDHNRRYQAAAALARFAESAIEGQAASVAMSFARCGRQSAVGRILSTATEGPLAETYGRLRQVTGKAAAEIGAIEIPVTENDPAYPIYKSNAEYVQGNLDTAWALYDEHPDRLAEVLRLLPVDYGLWLLQRNIDAEEEERAENLVKELTIWSRQAQGTFSLEQDARLKIAYAELAFRKGALPTARAWFRQVADAAEYEGSAMQLEAALGSVKVDRVSRNFGAALTELDQLMRLPNPDFRMRVHYARAEVLMDQENFAEALAELESVLRRDPKHPDALILRGQIHYQMRKLVEASEIELGPSQNDTLIVPGEAVKINLRDPTLRVSGVGADIEVEIRAKSGDQVRVLLYQLGDSKDKFRAEVPTELGPPNPNDKVLQVLGEDEIRFGFSQRFRAKMDDLPPDPDLAIGVASDAHLDFTAGAFPPREGERRLDISELGLSTAQAALGTRAVRPGNPVYLRITDPDRSVSPEIDEVTLTLEVSSGDRIRQLVLRETGPFSGEFEAVVPTTGAQAIAFASESAPGRDPNMAISSHDYPGWQGEVGDKARTRTFGVDLNDNVALKQMTLDVGRPGEALTHFILQTSMNGETWTERARYPVDEAPPNGQPHLASLVAFRHTSPLFGIGAPEGRDLPETWRQAMELKSAHPEAIYAASHVTGLSSMEPKLAGGHFSDVVLIRYRAFFHQPDAAIRRFQLTGYPAGDEKNQAHTIFLLNGEPAAEESQDPMIIERELAPGLHSIEVWRWEKPDTLRQRQPVLLCDAPGKAELVPCPDAMFDPSTFPDPVRAQIPQPAIITTADDGTLQVAFGEGTRARMVRLVIHSFEGVAPAVRKVTLGDLDGNAVLPVAQDYKALRENTQLEVLPGDQIIARYQDPVTATPKRDRHERRLGVAYNTGTITASFLNYETNRDGERVLALEPIRRFRMDDAIAIVIDDADLDSSPERDVIDFTVTSSDGATATLKAVETEDHSGRFMGRVFPVAGEPSRDSEIRLSPGGTLTAIYRDVENLDPGIPYDRTVTIAHARYSVPALSAYGQSSEPLPPPAPPETGTTPPRGGPEVFPIRRGLAYAHRADADTAGAPLDALIGADLRFDVIAPHLALAGSSGIRAYVQTDAARKAAGAAGKPFDVTVPGTLKLTGTLGATGLEAPLAYSIATPPAPPTNEPPLEEGRFSFAVPLILGETPTRSFATKSADELPASAIPDGLAVKAGDLVHVGFPWQDEDKKVHWKTTTFTVGSHAFLDVMEDGYREPLASAYVGEKIHLRLLAPGLDRGPDRDIATVTLEGTSGARTRYEVRETEAHSGIFKGVFTVSYADEQIPAELPPVALNGFPVRYGDDITVSYEDQRFAVNVNKGADGVIEPFSKRFTGDEMAVRTSFTLAECYFELAKKHREMEQESLARREIGQARKLLAEALATHRDDALKAHAEYLLGNLSQEFADLAKNDETRLPLYQDALKRFSKIPTDYPETEFAPKAQFKTALVYEKMGEIENSVEEYVKLAYKYPNDELIPTVMGRLGGYFQKKGQAFKDQADLLRDREDGESRAEVLRLDQLSYPEFLNAAMVFSKLQERFPDDPLAGLAGLRAAQNFMRAHQYDEAISQFRNVIDNEHYDGPEIRAQAIYWTGISHERAVGLMAESNWKGRGNGIQEAYQLYRRVTFDFPDSKWAKFARGRLADRVFERIIFEENQARERMIEQINNIKKSRKR